VGGSFPFGESALAFFCRAVLIFSRDGRDTPAESFDDHR
jgi:hypothetical protein